MKNIKYLMTILTLGLLMSCQEYLDVVPDNIATIEENAFSDKTNAEKFLFTCYSYMPEHQDGSKNPAFTAGDEAWLGDFTVVRWGDLDAWRIARGEQNVTAPFLNFWDGANGGKPLFMALRDCNIFLENINRPVDLDEDERNRWIAEVKVLKAYYHYYLMSLYGPIPIIKENIDVSSSTDAVRVYREPVSEVVKYIAQLVDEAASDLPLVIENRASDLGRMTRPIALAIKAKAYLLAASPLFNGNKDFSAIDKRGVEIFPQEEDKKLWQLAATTTKAAIDAAEEAGHALYVYSSLGSGRSLSDSTLATLNIRGSVTEKWNNEIIWGSSRGATQIQTNAFPSNSAWIANYYAADNYRPTYRMAELFYSDNGVPIEEDVSFDYANRLQTQAATVNEQYYMKVGYVTHKLNFHREVRYYADMLFDGSAAYGFGKVANDRSLISFDMKLQWGVQSFSGYMPLKLIHWESVANNSNAAGSLVLVDYSFPIIRLADLYLMYAEALNEVKSAPDAEVYQYINKIRQRAGLNGVMESWANHSTRPDKPTTQSGMREIIHQERLIELAFEGQRFWDLRRWKMSYKYMNSPIMGWDYENKTDYVLKPQFLPHFERKNYFWPIKQSSLVVNTNLVQNPGWK